MTQDIADRFPIDTASHEMTIVHDDGLYRHVAFRNPGQNFYWFELCTTPNMLVFRGDGRSFVFSRERDMFNFFRRSNGVRPQYWAEKLTCHSDGRVYDVDIFTRQVKDAFVEAARTGGGVPPGTGLALRDLLDDSGIEDETEAHRLLNNFEHDGFRFEDTWEWDFRDYHWWFLWACEAIAWGIKKYDTAQSEAS